MRARHLLPLAAAMAAVLAAPVGAPASPATCASPCEITTIAYGYIAPVTAIASGSLVQWATTDESHPTTDTFIPQDQCFLVQVAASVDPIPVRFDIVGDSVMATEAPGAPGATAKRCRGAVETATGAYALQYRCMVHGFMNGVLLIEP